MELENIKILYKYFFKKNKITRDHVYNSFEIKSNIVEYDLKDSFVEYIEKIRDKFCFYKFCLQILKKDKINQPEREKCIIQEIRNSNTKCDENDLEECEFIYNWYLEDRVEYLLCNNLDYFLDIIDKLNIK